MESFRFVHAADLHLDSPFRGLLEVNDKLGHRLQEASLRAFDNLLELCRSERADFLVVAGDVYDTAERAVRAQVRFWNGLGQLAGDGIQSFVVHGNHDPLDHRLSDAGGPDGVHVFGPEPSWAVATREGRPLAEIQGVSFPTQAVTENLAARFAPRRDSDLFAIGLLHCNVGGNPGHDNYAPCTVQDLVNIGLDYWALGHVHTRQTLRKSSPVIAYPGNLQGRHPGETGARGCLMVDVAESGHVHVEFRPLDVVRWDTGEVSIEGAEGAPALHARIMDKVEELQGRSDGRDLVCRLTLAGRGPLHRELARPDALAEFLAEAREAVSPSVWIERLENRTRPTLDLEARARQGDFLAGLLSRASAADPEELRELLAPVFSGRRGALAEPPPNEARKWLEEARWYLAELFEPEG